MSDVYLSGKPGQGTSQPAAPTLPAIPAYDGTHAGLEGTLGALVETVRHLAGQHPGANNKAKSSGNSGNPRSPSNNKKPDGNSRFSEVSRTKNKVKISNPNDPTQYVEVEQITKLVMQDNVTREQWTWTL